MTATRLTDLEERDQRSLFRILGFAFWVGGACLCSVVLFDPPTRLIGLSLITVVFSAWVFINHGGRTVTAAGVFAVCIGLFCGYSGIYWYLQDSFFNHAVLANGVLIVHLSHAVIYYFFWANTDEPPSFGPVTENTTSGAAPLGLIMLLAGGALASIGVLRAITVAAAFVGAILVAAALLASTRTSLRTFGFVGSALIFFFYVEFVFVGYGRLTLSAMAFAIMTLATLRYRSYIFKLGTIVALPVALAYLVARREQFGKELYGTELDGIGSVVGPMKRFAEMIPTVDELPLAWGHTFYAAAVTFVPSGLWEDKPVGFGRVLSEYYNPELASIGHSYAAMTFGEYLFNFGLVGLPLAALASGLLIRLIDSLLRRSAAHGITDRMSLVSLVAIVLLIGGVTDIVWGGYHTFMSRTGARLLIVGAIAVFWARVFDNLRAASEENSRNHTIRPKPTRFSIQPVSNLKPHR
ncbi:hypothetical protein [uncultured Corynebacterium sp.]|uniref:hypothetical protein n=1 Tax=uncultured Corynebacterium sp. TaxID=159447 RepID=UPI002600C434|nr:hypothetical protein [uncultured Corynebacterium sp.]